MPKTRKKKEPPKRVEIKKIIGRDIDGKAIRKSFRGATKDEALLKWSMYVNEQTEKENKKIRTPFVEWAEKWLFVYKEPTVKPSTFYTSYRMPTENHIIPFFKKMYIQEVTALDLQFFMNKKTHLSMSMLSKLSICLNGIFETAIDNDLITKNPCRNLTKRSTAKAKKKRTYDRYTADHFCAASSQYALSVHILLRMGLRCSELCALKWKNVDLNKGTMTICEARTIQLNAPAEGEPKSATSKRRLPIPEDLLERMRAYRKEHPDDEYVHMINGHPGRPDHFGERELEVFYNAERVPIDQRLTAHELRHTCGTLLYQETKDIFHVSTFLGHSDVSVTSKIYVHSAFSDDPIHVEFDE